VVQAVDGDVAAEVGRLNLSRQDLMAFACLTGSDLAGSGLDKVGHKKAIRFIRKCQLDHPHQAETAAMDELKSWARSVAPREDDFDPFDPPNAIPKKRAGPSCSCCQHAGSKRSHLKDGCDICGTEPGEACFESTSEDRFRQGLRAKALALFPKFDPTQVVNAYMRPNKNQIPVLFAGNRRPRMDLPNLSALLKLKLIVKGRSYETSRDFIKLSVGRILSHAELEETESEVEDDKENQEPVRPVRDKPVPLEITKVASVNSVPSYHITWRVGASLTDDTGNGIDGYEYSTVEQQSRVQKRFPDLVEKYKQAEKERLKQGDGEQNRRRVFLDALWIDVAAPPDELEEQKENPGDPSPRKRRAKKKRQDVFGNQKPPRAPLGPSDKNVQGGGDVLNLLRFAKGRSALQNHCDSSIESVDEANSNHLTEEGQDDDSSRAEPRVTCAEETSNPPSPLLCKFGSYWIPISPIDAMRPGEYPPRRIYVRRPLASDL
jgi:flap endonuclease GEN